MNYTILSKDYGDVENLIPMSEITQHIRQDDPEEEVLLSVYRDAAIDFAERFMNRALLPQTALAYVDSWRKIIYLPLATKPTVTSVSSGLVNTIDHEINNVVVRAGGVFLPETLKSYSDFTISYEVNPSDMPPAVKIGILKLIATWYENREDVSNGISVAEIPFNHKACFELYRINAGV